MEQIRNEQSLAKRLPIRHRYKSSHQSRQTHRQHHDYVQHSEYPISFATPQSGIDDGSDSDFLYYNSLAVIENQSIPSQVREANSNVKED